MNNSNSYVYFALKGDDFNPKEITKRIGILQPKAGQKETNANTIQV